MKGKQGFSIFLIVTDIVHSIPLLNRIYIFGVGHMFHRGIYNPISLARNANEGPVYEVEAPYQEEATTDIPLLINGGLCVDFGLIRTRESDESDESDEELELDDELDEEEEFIEFNDDEALPETDEEEEEQQIDEEEDDEQTDDEEYDSN